MNQPDRHASSVRQATIGETLCFKDNHLTDNHQGSFNQRQALGKLYPYACNLQAI